LLSIPSTRRHIEEEEDYELSSLYHAEIGGCFLATRRLTAGHRIFFFIFATTPEGAIGFIVLSDEGISQIFKSKNSTSFYLVMLVTVKIYR
jgi:hypothetical protein